MLVAGWSCSVPASIILLTTTSAGDLQRCGAGWRRHRVPAELGLHATRVALGAGTVDLLRAHRVEQAKTALACGATLAPTAYVFSHAADASVPLRPDCTESLPGNRPIRSLVSNGSGLKLLACSVDCSPAGDWCRSSGAIGMHRTSISFDRRSRILIVNRPARPDRSPA
jgi:hypothetical protein